MTYSCTRSKCPIAWEHKPVKRCTAENCKFRTITNADRIRAMTDEELASKFADIYCPDGLSANHKNCKHNYLRGSPIEICEECWLEWLKEEKD